jgi:hypothetical protein
MLKCNVCGGTYNRTMPDGTQYFHVCPPLSVVELRDQLQKKTVQLTPAQQKTIDDAAKIDADPNAPKVDVPRADVALAFLVVERPNKRDENVVGPGAPGQPAPMKAPGTGTTTV